jgi:hypothetical protein
MGKAIGLLLAVIAIWVTVELYTAGFDQAFGGSLAAFTGDGDQAPRGSATQRAGDAVRDANELHDSRYGELVPE